MTAGRIVVMGSGETTPTMVKVHREVFDAGPHGPAVMLDTPFAFQANRAELVARTRTYFAQSVGRDVEVASWSGTEEAAQQERSLALVDRATWVFAGPGSPTYALRRWRGSAVPAALAAVVRRGGTLVLGSAAALTLGSHAVPVYEIYKVGEDPTWADGLDLLGGLTGVRAAVIPHYDNKEGGTHDTRYCYLGEARLRALEERLPDDVGVVGVDEHTAVIVDVDARTIAVSGNGRMTVRRRGHSRTFGAGDSIGLGELSAMLRGDATSASKSASTSSESAERTPVSRPEPVAFAASLRAESERARTDFDSALARRDVDGCIAAVLGLEQALADWSADTLQSDDAAEARRVLRALVVRLGELAERGSRAPSATLEPFVAALLEVRRSARDAKDFATADLVRDRLVAAGINVHDTADGTTTWSVDEV